MMKPIKEKHPEINLVAIDYDSGATRVNQENRIRLMLSNAKKGLTASKNPAARRGLRLWESAAGWGGLRHEAGTRICGESLQRACVP